jgi:Ca2+-binding EF-hand superfamily protein
LSQEDEQHLKAVFDSIDIDGDGSIDRHELKRLLSSTGQNASDENVSTLLEVGQYFAFASSLLTTIVFTNHTASGFGW